MNNYVITMTDNPITGSQTTTNMTAKEFVCQGDYVIFLDEENHVIFAAPLTREPIVALVQS